MSRQVFTAVDGADAAPASHTAVTASATRTNLWNPALWSFIPAMDMRAGKCYLVRCGGVLSTNSSGTNSIIFNPTFGQSSTPASNLALGVSTTVTLTNSLSSVPWWAEFLLTCRSLGVAASGATVTGNGYAVIGGAAAAAGIVIPFGGTVVTTADHTTAQGIALDVTWGAASNSITAQWQLLQSLS